MFHPLAAGVKPVTEWLGSSNEETKDTITKGEKDLDSI
jgi:hypothetical protein